MKKKEMNTRLPRLEGAKLKKGEYVRYSDEGWVVSETHDGYVIIECISHSESMYISPNSELERLPQAEVERLLKQAKTETRGRKKKQVEHDA